MPANATIQVADLSYRYPAGGSALENIHFLIHPSESVGLVGPNGAGKTSLFLCLSGVLPIKPGSAVVAGIDPGDRSKRHLLASQVGIVFQNSDDQLFNSTVFEDVAFGPLNLGLPPEEVKIRVAEAIVRVGLAGLEDRVPFHLSGGEKRRAALAGVLAMRPEILLLDEPSMHLDPRGRNELIRLINGLPVTKVIASHDLEFILKTCHRVLILDAGKIVADGPVRSILADFNLMEAHGLEVPHSLTPHAATDRHHRDPDS